MRIALLAVCLFAVASSQSSEAASPNLPPAEYKPLPVGTVIEYDTWTCEVVHSADFVTECRDSELGRVSMYGLIQPFGTTTKAPPLNNLSPVIFSGDWKEQAVRLDSVNISKEARDAIRNLWPLKAGNRVKYKPDHDAVRSGGQVPPEVTAEVEVIGSESLIVAGYNHDTQIVSNTVTRRYQGSGKDDNFRRTLWIDPKLGIIVKQKHEWLTGYRKGKTNEYELVSVKFPGGAPAIAKAAPEPKTTLAPRQTSPTATTTQVTAPAYTGPPVGTVIEYDNWTCEVVRSDGFVTECRDPEFGRVSLYGTFEPFGNNTKAPPLKAVLPVLYASGKGIAVRRLAIGPDSRQALQGLWPLAQGKSAIYGIEYDAYMGYGGTVETTATVEIGGIEAVEAGSGTRDAYVISQRVVRKVIPTRGSNSNDEYHRTIWMDPEWGIILKDRLEWLTGYRQGKTSEYRLVKVTFPQDAPGIAQAVPHQAPVAQPAPTQQPAPLPKVAALPPPKPPVQKAVEVEIDERGPAIEIPAEIATDKAAVEITGRILDDSRIIEVRLDGRPVPMAADGTVAVRRGVPVGTTTFTLAAIDEWGNASQQSVTVNRSVATAPKVVAKPKAVPKPVAKVAIDQAGPEINVPQSLSTTERTVQLTGRVSDASKVIEVTVEGRPVALGADGAIVLRRALSIGANTIRVAALDEWGNKTEKRISVERRRPFADINFGTYHAIVIGNNDYAGMPNLKTAVADAQAVAQTLRQDYGYTVNLLVNATRTDIIDALAKARATLKANDNLLIYYAGHGILDTYAEEGFWLPVDAKKDSPSNWVSNGDVTNMLRAIRAKHVMVIADSCYSGTLVRTTTADIKTAKEREAWLKKVVKKRTRTALVSGGLEPVIDSGGGNHSVFAKAFLDALLANEDVLEAERLFSEIKRPVALESDQTPQYSDVRRAGHDGGDFLFVRR